MAFEIERKYLIEYPDINLLEKYADSKSEIAQTYLKTDDGFTSRVRKRTTDGVTKYIFTEKKRITDVKCIENEREIGVEEYEEILKLADPERRTVEKMRYCIPYKDRVVEVDIYPFWSDRAIAEVEMEDENETVSLPDFIKVICDVTAEKAYKNYSIAKEIPNDC
ncbi:MAG: hypothetical protein J6S71_03740 [Clostridia bacterium]|nr:hypothetical protein [Clostridia bacterium]